MMISWRDCRAVWSLPTAMSSSEIRSEQRQGSGGPGGGERAGDGEEGEGERERERRRKREGLRLHAYLRRARGGAESA